MNKQSLSTRAVKITAVSMLTLGLFFNIGIDFESEKFGIPTIKSITFGNSAYALEEEDPKIAKKCRYTGNMDDSCPDGLYTIARCVEKSVVDTTPSTCGYYPNPT
ncbi:hypothetical protein [Algoriphagus aquimarinus]|uniref:hypothetical protein n=1 Tax=Algoriphagus aquimarinus TaxID=237018 RepID=UPI0030DB3FFF|tara:strand:- start:143094 stop:143408 length:315 start_codon:yes stop_codon:yes gene_type:complete